MTATEPETVRVGGLHLPMATAKGWVARYTDAALNRSAASPYAYPAYDHFRSHDNHPDVLDDADLLAPVLLNVGISIRSFYALQRHRDRLQLDLAAPDLARPLAALSDDDIAHHIGGLFAVLDAPGHSSGDGDPSVAGAVSGIGATKLSKVLHRKRPAAIPLHDRWVRVCYVTSRESPVPRARKRTWREYMTLVAQAMACDLRAQPDQYTALQKVSKADPPLTDLRLLDILAWHAGQRPGGFTSES